MLVFFDWQGGRILICLGLLLPMRVDSRTFNPLNPHHKAYNPSTVALNPNPNEITAEVGPIGARTAGEGGEFPGKLSGTLGFRV